MSRRSADGQAMQGAPWVAAFGAGLTAPLTSLIVIVLMFAASEVLAPGFVSLPNVMRLAELAGFLGIVAIGETLVILTGGIDLSIAWVVTGPGCVFTKVTQGHGDMLAVGLAAALAVGLATGLVNGIGITKFRISPIVMTLGMNNIMQGLTLLYTNGTPTGGTPPAINARHRLCRAGAGAGAVLGGAGRDRDRGAAINAGRPQAVRGRRKPAGQPPFGRPERPSHHHHLHVERPGGGIDRPALRRILGRELPWHGGPVRAAGDCCRRAGGHIHLRRQRRLSAPFF